MSDYGAKISLPGSNFDGDLNKLLLHSAYPLLKIHSSGSGVQNYTAGTWIDVLITTHGLGYKPMFLFYSQYFDDFSDAFVSNFRIMPWGLSSSSGLLYNFYQPYVSTTTLRYYISTGGAGVGGTFNINYYWFVFYETE